jgi:hypothetical protein
MHVFVGVIFSMSTTTPIYECILTVVDLHNLYRYVYIFQIIRRYDIVLVQEIRDSKGQAIVKLLDEVNK